MLLDVLNGGWHFTVAEDGTKVRTKVSDEPPEFPESIDLKITNYCDAGCAYCHESSTKKGVHADPKFVDKIIHECWWKAEVAIGGGNPLSFPNIERILDNLAVCNLTVNRRNLESTENLAKLLALVGNGLVHGIGISMTEPNKWVEEQEEGLFNILMQQPNVVAHLIAGVNDWKETLQHRKVLVLGFKNFGFGAKYLPKTESTMKSWQRNVAAILTANPEIEGQKRIVAFDNLALEQLRVKDYVPQDTWDAQYMGDDGQFTMYIDAVRQEFAKSSTSPRKPCGDLSVKEMFEIVREE